MISAGSLLGWDPCRRDQRRYASHSRQNTHSFQWIYRERGTEAGFTIQYFILYAVCTRHSARSIQTLSMLFSPKSVNKLSIKVLLTLMSVLKRICLKAWILHKVASIRTITGSYSMYLSTGFLHELCREKKTHQLVSVLNYSL